MIRRQLKARLIRAAAHAPIVLLGGPTGVGKRALIEEAFDCSIVSLFDLEARSLAVSDPVSFLDCYHKGTTLAIDGIHLAPRLLPYLLATVEERPCSGIFLLTTSKRIEGISNNPSITELTVLPPSIQELEAIDKSPDSIEETIWNSGVAPSNNASDPSLFYGSYLQGLLEQEIPRHLRLTRPDAFITFTKLCAGAVGEVVNYSRLGDNCGVSHASARAWLKVLVDHYLCFLLEPYHQGFGKRLVKTPKLYFFDPALAAYLLGIRSANAVVSHYHRGALFESWIISELMKRRESGEIKGELFFWRDKLGNEIDLIVEAEGGPYPIEIKAGKTVSASYFEGLIRWNSLANSDPQLGTIAYAGDDNHTHPMARIVSWKAIDQLIPEGILV